MAPARLYSDLQDLLLGQEVAYPEVAIPVETLRELCNVCFYPQHSGVPHGRRTYFALSCQNSESFHHLFSAFVWTAMISCPALAVPAACYDTPKVA